MKHLYRKFTKDYRDKLDTIYQSFNKSNPICSLEIRKQIKLYGFVNYWAKRKTRDFRAKK